MTDTDRGYAAMVKRVFAFRRPRIVTGLLEAEGQKPHTATGERGELLTVLEVAIWNEFGTIVDGQVHTPERSFVRAWFDDNEPRLRQDLKKMMIAVIRGERTRDQILELMAQRCVGEIQQRIADGIPPPNADSTVRRKGSSTPLIATGQMRSSVTYRIEER